MTSGWFLLAARSSRDAVAAQAKAFAMVPYRSARATAAVRLSPLGIMAIKAPAAVLIPRPALAASSLGLWVCAVGSTRILWRLSRPAA